MAIASKKALYNRRVQIGLRTTVFLIYLATSLQVIASLAIGIIQDNYLNYGLVSNYWPRYIATGVAFACGAIWFLASLITAARSNKEKNVHKIPFGMSKPLIILFDVTFMALVCILATFGFSYGGFGDALNFSSVITGAVGFIIHYCTICTSLYHPDTHAAALTAATSSPITEPLAPNKPESVVHFNPRLTPSRMPSTSTTHRTFRGRNSRPATINESEWEIESAAGASTIDASTVDASGSVHNGSHGRPPTYVSYQGSLLSEPGTISTIGGTHEEKVPLYEPTVTQS